MNPRSRLALHRWVSDYKAVANLLSLVTPFLSLAYFPGRCSLNSERLPQSPRDAKCAAHGGNLYGPQRSGDPGSRCVCCGRSMPLSTYLPTYLPTYLHAYMHTHTHTYILAHTGLVYLVYLICPTSLNLSIFRSFYLAHTHKHSPAMNSALQNSEHAFVTSVAIPMATTSSRDASRACCQSIRFSCTVPLLVNVST